MIVAGDFGEVQIPPAVRGELLAKAGPESPRLAAALGDFLRVTPPSPGVLPGMHGLGAGEREAIALALDLGATLLIDDRLGRIAAGRSGVVVTGTVGVLVRAKQLGLLAEVVPMLEQIRRAGYWLSDELLRQAATLAGEPPPMP